MKPAPTKERQGRIGVPRLVGQLIFEAGGPVFWVVLASLLVGVLNLSIRLHEARRILELEQRMEAMERANRTHLEQEQTQR